MVQVPILSGITTARSADFVRSYPVNLDPHVEAGGTDGTGISRGYLKLCAGVRTVAQGGPDRGGHVWRGGHYRVLGSTFHRVGEDGELSALGDVGPGGRVVFAESFDRLAVASRGRLHYWNGSALSTVTDPDLGDVRSLAWSDGYFLTTDGTSIVATELNDPTAVDPLKYGSSEADPDPVMGLLALRGIVYALNRHSIEAFENAGTTGFPFRRNRGSQIPKGCVGASAFCPFIETFAFVGSARNEPPGVYLAGAGQAIPIAPGEVADDLAALSPDELAGVEMETVAIGGAVRLLVHLPARTWVYHWTASQQLDTPVWSVRAGGADLDRAYPARGFTWHDGRWWCGSDAGVGVVDEAAATLFGEAFGWRFDTPLIYNGGAGAVVHALDLVTLGGRGPSATIWESHTDDGATWSAERPSSAGRIGERSARPAWRRLGRMRHWRGFRFRGVAQAPVAFARLEATLEPLGG